MFFSPRLVCLLVSIFAISELACAKTTGTSTSSVSSVASVTSVVHEARKSAPPGWQKIEKVVGGAPLMLKIGLAQSNLDKADVSQVMFTDTSFIHSLILTSDIHHGRLRPQERQLRQGNDTVPLLARFTLY